MIDNSSKKKSSKRKAAILSYEDDESDSEEEEMCDDVILELGQEMINHLGERGKVTKVYPDDDGWHLYDVTYNGSTSWDKGLWGDQLKAYVPKPKTCSKKAKCQTLAQGWDMVSVSSSEQNDKASLLP